MYVKMSTYSFIQLLTSSSYVFLGYHFPVPHKGILFLVLLEEKSLYLSLAVSYLYCSQGPSIKEVVHFWPFLTPSPPDIDPYQLMDDPSLKNTYVVNLLILPPPHKKSIPNQKYQIFCTKEDFHYVFHHKLKFSLIWRQKAKKIHTYSEFQNVYVFFHLK